MTHEARQCLLNSVQIQMGKDVATILQAAGDALEGLGAEGAYQEAQKIVTRFHFLAENMHRILETEHSIEKIFPYLDSPCHFVVSRNGERTYAAHDRDLALVDFHRPQEDGEEDDASLSIYLLIDSRP